MTNPTACLLVIGNEVLSGRTQDLNIKFLATGLGAIGIPLREVRVIPDVAETIVLVVNECRAKFDHVFTTGGIGPTHDDITTRVRRRGVRGAVGAASGGVGADGEKLPAGRVQRGAAAPWRRCRAGRR